MDAETLRDTMRCWTTGVAVISARTGEARHGMTVNSFTSVSLDPPLVSVCIQNDLRILPMIRESGTFAISVLAAGQAEMSNRFAGRSTEYVDRFEDLSTRTAVTGAPVLADALAYFDCEVEASYPGGTHTIVVGRVLEARRVEGEPLLYWNRGYRAIADAAPAIRELMEAFDHWRHDQLHQLGLVQSWTQVALQENEPALPELVGTALESILAACTNALAQWNNITHNLLLRYSPRPPDWKPIHLEQAIPAALERLKESSNIDPVAVRLPGGLPPVRSTEYLGAVVENLVALKAIQNKDAARAVEVSSLDDGRIQVQCTIAAPLSEFTQRVIFHPGSEFDSARFFIRQHGSELTVTRSAQGTGFEFSLPVWRDGNPE